MAVIDILREALKTNEREINSLRDRKKSLEGSILSTEQEIRQKEELTDELMKAISERNSVEKA